MGQQVNTGVHHYDEEGDVRRRNLSFLEKHFFGHPALSRWFEKGAIRRMLDVGCGNGRSWALFAECFYNIQGIDPYTRPDDRFKQINCDFQPVSLDDFECEDSSFDVVLFLGSFYLMKDKLAALRKCADLLRPEGAIVIMDDAKRSKPMGAAMFKTDGLTYDLKWLCQQAGLMVTTEVVDDETRFTVVRCPNKKPYMVFGIPNIREAEIREVVHSMKEGWIGTGPKVKLFAEMFKEMIGCKHAIPVGSCTAGLFLSLKVMGVGRGDEVITTPLTFASTVNVIEHLGAKPVFVDVERSTGLIDLKLVKEAFTDRTKAVVPVHLYGRPVNVLYLDDLAVHNGAVVVEDAAHAIEASSGMVKIGTSRLPTCFSFYATKNITTCEGGMVTCGDDEIAARIAALSNHGLDKDAWKRYSDDGFKHYEVVEPGYKFNMTDMQAAIGIHQLPHLWEWHEHRGVLWQRYMDGLADTPLELPVEGEYDGVHAMHLFTVLVDEEQCGIGRDVLAARLHNKGIGTGIHYVPVHMQPYYREKYGYGEGDFPKSEYIGGKTLSLPLSSSRTVTDVDRVIDAIKEILP